MSAVIGFKRFGIAVVSLVLLIFGALGVVSLLISHEQVREAVKAEIHAVTGLDPILRGDIAVSLFPSGSVSFSNVLLEDDHTDEPPLAADKLSAKLKFFPLLTGRIEVADVALENPRINVAINSDGTSNWSTLVTSLARTLTTGPSRSGRAMSFSEIRISGGRMAIRHAGHDLSEHINDIDLSLAWPAISKTFAASGTAEWRGETVNISLTIGDFATLLSGQRSGIKARLSGEPIKFAFDGALSTQPTLKIDGTVAADSTSLRRVFAWAGQRTLPSGGFGPFTLKAQTNVVGGTIALTSVNLELDGNQTEGVLTFATDGRQTLQGTLAADALDLTPYVPTLRVLTTSEREWSRVPFDVERLNAFDLDLRLSAAKVSIATARLGRTALATNLRGGKFTLTIGECQAFGGIAKGSIGFAKARQGAKFQSQLQFTDIDLETGIGELFGIRRLEGKGDLVFNLEGSGPHLLALTRSLNGTASLSGHNGALTGLNIEQLLRRLERRPLSFGSEARTGRTPFQKLNIVAKVSNGVAAISDVSLQGSAVRLAMAGTASISTRDFDLKGSASLAALPNADGKSGFELPFVVQGPWDDPIVLPDPEILIRRSGAAAPLFDAVHDRRAREAVRAAIEKLGGMRNIAPTGAFPELPGVKDEGASEPDEPNRDTASGTGNADKSSQE